MSKTTNISNQGSLPSEGRGVGSTWIWYPGDFEIWLGNLFNNRRTERGAMFPPFWKQEYRNDFLAPKKQISQSKYSMKWKGLKNGKNQ
jgi:hypothetical protein